ncbi:hypothetical protein IAD21_03136 [Abditibacteriota bacterium]|nr:hypothetical protein IAD21_03136 [Abditibacteriota bacterium]
MKPQISRRALKLAFSGVLGPLWLSIPNASVWAQNAPQVRITSEQKTVAAGRTVLISAQVTQKGKPVGDALLVPYVNGQRFGDPLVTSSKGRASTYLPLFDTTQAIVQFDIVQKDAGGKWILDDKKAELSDRWIWAPEVSDGQNIWLQKTFNLAEKPKRGTLYIGADDEAQVFVNGDEVNTTKGWNDTTPLDVTSLLKTGENVISVRAHNGTGPASFVARLDADKRAIVSDGSWKFWNESPREWPARSEGGTPVKVMGTLSGYIISPAKWPHMENHDKLRDDGLLVLSPTVSNALMIRVTAPVVAAKAPLWDTFADTWVATDGLGRSLPTYEDVGGPRPNKTVGIFYYIWHSMHSRIALRLQQPVFNVTDELLTHPDKPQFARATNWWNEPLFGYYNASDRWVLRKHVQMLADAGIDTLIYDTSNEAYYWSEWLNHADLLESMRQSGAKTPSLAHLFWASTQDGFPDVSRRFYDAGLYRDLWFNWKGKPLVLADATNVKPELASKYSLRTSWAWTNPGGWFGDGRDKWPWLAETPQGYGWHEDPNKPEQLIVTAGHHASTNKGRSMIGAVEPDKPHQHPEQGLQFAEQWKRVPQVDPEFLFITQWNEWIAGAYAPDRDGQVFDGRVLTKNDSFLIDEYNSEFSRDLEPTKNDADKAGLSDNYYYQMVAGIRRFKGVRKLAPISSKTIPMNGDFSAWKGVGPEFRDTLGDTAHRDAWGWGWNKHYVDNTGRNDIRSAKVAFDARNLYFYMQSQDKLTRPVAGDWMTLYLDTDCKASTGWMGYDLRVRGTEVQQYSAHGWTKIATVTRKIGACEIELSMPRSLLFIGVENPRAVDFKWTDNCEDDGTWRDFSLHGDAAPNDRFNFRAKFPT